MGKEKPRLARLTAIITQLQSKRLVTAREIATKHQVSIRTVYRDIKTLENSGIPIATEEGKGYYMMEDYKLPPVMFTEEEANALIMAEHLILKNKDSSLSKQYQNAVTKIRSILRHSQKDKSELLDKRIQVRTNSPNEKTSNYLIQLQSNISNFQLIHVEYLSADNQMTSRKVEPFALYTTQENWILIAYCRLRKEFRAFRLDRIKHLVVTTHTFPPHTITLEEYFEECRKKYFTTPDTPLTQSISSFTSNIKNKDMQEVKTETIYLIGIAVRTTNKDGQAGKDIAGLWQRFLSENLQSQIPNLLGSEIYSLYTDYEGDHTNPYTAILGCKVKNLDNIPKGMEGRTIAGGKYVKMSARGDINAGLILNQWHKIFDMNLDRNFEADFEVFGQKAQNPSDAEVDFYVGIHTN